MIWTLAFIQFEQQYEIWNGIHEEKKMRPVLLPFVYNWMHSPSTKAALCSHSSSFTCVCSYVWSLITLSKIIKGLRFFSLTLPANKWVCHGFMVQIEGTDSWITKEKKKRQFIIYSKSNSQSISSICGCVCRGWGVQVCQFCEPQFPREAAKERQIISADRMSCIKKEESMLALCPEGGYCLCLPSLFTYKCPSSDSLEQIISAESQVSKGKLSANKHTLRFPDLGKYWRTSLGLYELNTGWLENVKDQILLISSGIQ